MHYLAKFYDQLIYNSKDSKIYSTSNADTYREFTIFKIDGMV